MPVVLVLWLKLKRCGGIFLGKRPFIFLCGLCVGIPVWINSFIFCVDISCVASSAVTCGGRSCAPYRIVSAIDDDDVEAQWGCHAGPPFIRPWCHDVEAVGMLSVHSMSGGFGVTSELHRM